MKSRVLSKPLQIKKLQEWCAKHGINLEERGIDLNELVDPALTYSENKSILIESLGTDAPDESDVEIDRARFEDARMAYEIEHGEEEGAEAKEEAEAKEQLEAKIIELCRKNPDYVQVLKAVVEFEKKNPDREYWFWDNLQINPGYLSNLVRLGILNRPYKTNRYTCFKLVDADLTEKALATVESQLVEPAESVAFKEQTLSEADINELKTICEQADPLEYFSNLIAPKVIGLNNVKKALLTCLVCLDDEGDDRQRVHVFFVGKPSTAKTTLMLWLAHYLGAGYVSHATTDVGLVGDASRVEIVKGALPLNDGGILCVDELDKFKGADQAGCLEAMENGTVTITKGRHRVRLDARVKVVAGANDADRIIPPLLDRFDFVFKLDNPDPETMKDIISNRIDFWGLKKTTNFDLLEKFLAYVKRFKPKLEREKLKALMARYIAWRNANWSVRQYERFIRIALAIARIRQRDCTVSDMLDAIKLGDPELTYSVIEALERYAEGLES